MAATATREQLLAYIKKKTAAIKELEATNAQLLEAQQSSEAATSTLRHELEVQTAEAQAWQSQALEALAEVAHLKESSEKDQNSSLSAQQAAEAKEQVTLLVYAFIQTNAYAYAHAYAVSFVLDAYYVQV
jgi:hypothetical protein